MPSSFSFDVTAVESQSVLSPGAFNDTAAAVLRKHLNPTLKGPGWDAVVAAIAAGDALNWTNAVAAFDMAFLVSAANGYLDDRAADEGVRRPQSVGMSDDLFRELTIAIKNHQLTQEAIWEVLEVFYGQDATRASSTTTVAEPYALTDQDDLVLLLDEVTTFRAVFGRKQFGQVSAALAIEVAATLSRQLLAAGTNAYATTFTDPTTNKQFVKFYSGSRGLGSAVRVIGGSAQRLLQFPTPVFNSFSATSWVVAPSPTATGSARFTGGVSVFDLNELQVGDLAYFFSNDPTDGFEEAGIRGVFPVTSVETYYVVANPSSPRLQYFEIAFPNAPTATVSQTLATSLMFFRPTKSTIYDQPRNTVVVQSGARARVVLPATTQAVVRGPGTGAYLQGQAAVAATSLVREPSGVVTVASAAAHGLSVGDQLFVDGVGPAGTAPTPVTGTPSGAFSGGVASGTTDASPMTTASESDTLAILDHRVVRTAEGLLMVVGGYSDDEATASLHPKIFEVTSDTVQANGGRRIGYKWTDVTTVSYHVQPRATAASALLDGRVLVTGGTTSLSDFSGNPSTAWDLFTYTNSPVQIASVNGTLADEGDAGHAQCTLTTGDALICGGWSFGGALSADSQTFHPSSLVWTARGQLKQGRAHHELVALSSGAALAIGGVTNTGVVLNTCEKYNNGTHNWTLVGQMTYGRYNFGSCTLPDGRVLVVGGTGLHKTQDTATAPLNTCEVYDPVTGIWALAAPLAVARVSPIVQYLSTINSVLVAGGGDPSIEIFDLKTMKWSKSPTELGSGLNASAGGIAATDTFAVIGGTVAGTVPALDYVVVPGSNVVAVGGLNRNTTVASVPSPTSFTYEATDDTYHEAYVAAEVSASGPTFTPSKALPSVVGAPGPYTFDLKSGLAVTSTVAVLAQPLNENQSYRVLYLTTSPDPTPALAFPDAPGYIALDFGYDGQVGPIKYLGRFDESALLLDASSRFTSDVPAGVTVTLLQGRTPWQPTDPLVGEFWLTGSASGRVAAEQTIAAITAAGLEVDIEVVYPSDRGLGAEGFPTESAQKLSDAVVVFGGDDLDTEVPDARSGVED